jgi:hypothetical protein
VSILPELAFPVIIVRAKKIARGSVYAIFVVVLVVCDV